MGVRCAVRNLKKLKQLDYNRQLRVCVRAGVFRPALHMMSFSCSMNGSLSLETFFLLSPDPKHKHCSERTENTVSTYQLATMVDLSSELRESIQNVFPYISFRLGIVPFLTRFGASVQNINLDFLSDVDVFFITFSCPLVKCIYLYRCSFRSFELSLIPLPQRTIPPAYIENITYDGSSGGPIGREELLHLFMSPNLTNISLNYCSTLTDDILYAAFNSHEFIYLKQLTLVYCDNVSNEAFKSIFLRESNVLKYIKIIECRQLSSPVVMDEWNAVATRKNWDIEFIFN